MHNNFLNDILIGISILLLIAAMRRFNRNSLALVASQKELKWLKEEFVRKDFSQRVAILEAHRLERTRIAEDLHDELGAGLTAIRLRSEIIRATVKESIVPDLEKISTGAADLIQQMGVVIWSMIPANDSLESLVAFIRQYALRLFETSTVRVHLSSTSPAASLPMAPEIRRQLFLCVKESLHNVLRHARASDVFISISMQPELQIEIRDNGAGFDNKLLTGLGNGLKNINTRMKSIRGSATVECTGGTVITLSVDGQCQSQARSIRQ